jgi:hypothetical protein
MQLTMREPVNEREVTGMPLHRAVVILLLSLWLLGSRHISLASAQSSSAGFLSTIGIDTHLSYDTTPYAQTQNVITALQYLGIGTIRDGTPSQSDKTTLADYNMVANAGIRFNLLIHGDGAVQLPSEIANLHAFALAHPGAIAAIEGPNEVNFWPITYNGITDTYAAAAAVTKDLWTAVKADPLLAGAAVYAPTLGVDPAGEAKLGNLAPYVDYGNAHVYAGSHDNVWSNDMPYWLSVQAQPTPGKPMVVTETGYSMDGINVDQMVAAKYTLNTLFDDALNGVAKTYIYELVDIDPSLSVDRAGMFNGDWSPKPAATALHNLNAILTAAGAGTPAGTLNYSLSGLPATAHTMLLGSATTSDIAIWNDVTIWNASTSREIVAPTAALTLNLGGTFTSVNVYDPLTGTSPIQTYTNVSTINLAISDHPIIVRVASPATQSGSQPANDQWPVAICASASQNGE